MKPNITIKRPPVVDTFDLPTNEDRLTVEPGDFVKAIFEDTSIDEGISAERMWIKVLEASSEKIKGTLANSPAFIGMEWGEEVEVHPLDVIAISFSDDTEDEDDE